MENETKTTEQPDAKTSAGCVVRRTLYFIMVHHPTGLVRCGNAYSSKLTANSWKKFVSEYWRGMKTSVQKCDLEWIDGKLTTESIKLLDEQFNISA